MINKKYKNIKTGVIGTGSMGQNHARILSEISDFVGIADVNEKTLKLMADKFKVKGYVDYKELLNEVDAVSIAVPTIYHHEIALNAIDSNVHLLVEKPLAMNLEEASEIVKKAKEKDVVLAVGHIERHNPVIKYTKEKIDSGEWGNLISLSSRRVSNYPARISDVGVLYDLASHDIDICLYLSSSSVKSLYLTGGKMVSKHEDHINLVMNHKSGLISVVEANWLTPMKVRNLSITTSKCFVVLDYFHQSINIYKSNFPDVNQSNLYKSGVDFDNETINLERQEPLLLELSDFLSSINNNHFPLVTGEDGADVISIVESGIKSLEDTNIIKL